MDMLGKSNVERAAQGAVELEWETSSLQGDREKEQHTCVVAFSEPGDRPHLWPTHRDDQAMPNAERHDQSTTEHSEHIGQAPDARSGLHPHTRAPLQGRLEDRDSSIPGLQKGVEHETEELPRGSTQLTSSPCASTFQHGSQSYRREHSFLSTFGWTLQKNLDSRVKTLNDISNPVTLCIVPRLRRHATTF